MLSRVSATTPSLTNKGYFILRPIRVSQALLRNLELAQHVLHLGATSCFNGDLLIFRFFDSERFDDVDKNTRSFALDGDGVGAPD